MTTPRFAYAPAFDRNIGWLTEWEQQALRARRVAIAGMGGVGGVHLLSLARLGIGRFTIADLDTFDIVNFNRQFGAFTSTLGRPKVEVLAEMARDINPELDIRSFPHGVQPDTVDAFLDGVDLYVDGFDFFALDIRRKVFARCRELGIPAVTAAPIGMGTGFLIFTPDRMSFDDYFRLEGQNDAEQYLRFLVGFTPRGLHRPYLVDESRVDLAGQRGPSTVAACDLCAGVVAVAAVKLLLNRGGVKPAPYHHHYDAYAGRLVVSKLRWGNDGPLQRLKLAIGRRMFAAMSARAAPPAPSHAPLDALDEILTAARWAPSGDNTQPWRFERLGDDSVRIRISLSHASNIYEYREAEPTLLAAGILLESLRIAASGWQRAMAWEIEAQSDTILTLRASFRPSRRVLADPLLAELPLRSVNRRAYRTRRLRENERAALRIAAG
ncbi:MAG: ThiF family adenylyltransferase, partial [Rhodospirillales bacterium]|nr:ThiF family adenylyltransferase [Rhodospirillales bacterium]